jgi:hypothetical protein
MHVHRRGPGRIHRRGEDATWTATSIKDEVYNSFQLVRHLFEQSECRDGASGWRW